MEPAKASVFRGEHRVPNPKAKLRESEGIIAAFKEKLAEMVRRLFGHRSEKNQTGSSSASTEDPEKKPRGRQRGRPGDGRQKRPNLPVQKLLGDLPGGPPPCGQCGKPYRRNGTARFYVEIVWEVHLFRRFVAGQQYEQACWRPKPGLPQRVVAAPPARLMEHGLLSVESIVEGLLRKFLYSMPVERFAAEHGHVPCCQSVEVGTKNRKVNPEASVRTELPRLGGAAGFHHLTVAFE